MRDNQIAKELLIAFGIAKMPHLDEITDYQSRKSHVYGMQTVISFRFKDKRYYASDDYSLMDNPRYVKEVLEEFVPNIKGQLLKNPVPQSDGAVYAAGINGTEYYLFEAGD